MQTEEGDALLAVNGALIEAHISSTWNGRAEFEKVKLTDWYLDPTPRLNYFRAADREQLAADGVVLKVLGAYDYDGTYGRECLYRVEWLPSYVRTVALNSTIRRRAALETVRERLANGEDVRVRLERFTSSGREVSFSWFDVVVEDAAEAA